MSRNKILNSIEEGFEEACLMTRRHAKTFYFASLMLEEETRKAAYSVYAVCRISDNAADSSGSIRTKTDELLSVQTDIDLAYGNEDLDTRPLLLCFRQTARKYRIAKEYFNDLLSGMRMDLKVSRYNDFNALYDYCYKVAGVVGLIMLDIFGCQDPQAKTHAVELGIAMQLTNILRDIDEDFRRGRIYLPQEELKKFNVTEEEIAGGAVSAGFKELLRFNINRARSYYAKARLGIPMIKNYRNRITASVMAGLYSGILDKIENNGYDVFAKRAHLNTFEKIPRFVSTVLSETLKGKP